MAVDRGYGGLPLPSQTVIFERQVRVAAQIAPLATAASLVNIFLLGAFAIPAGQGRFRLAWVTAACITALISPGWLLRRSRPVWPTPRRQAILVAAYAGVSGLLNVVLAWHIYPGADSARRTIIAASRAGVVGCGAIALSTLRGASLTWVYSNGAAPAIGFALTRNRPAVVLSADLLLYVACLTVAVNLLSDSFRARCVAEYAARAERELVSLLLEDFEGGASDWLWQTDPSGLFVHVSERFREVSGLTEEVLRQASWPTLLARMTPLGGKPAGTDRLLENLASGAAFQTLLCELEIAGRRRFWALSGQSIFDKGDRDAGWRGVGSDVTVQQLHYEELARSASTDFLTGIDNRLSLDRLLRQTLDTPHRGQVVLAVLDIDDFKSVNNTLGHPVGDAVLVELAARLDATRLPSETCARLGGDEFALLLTSELESNPADRLADYARAFDRPFAVGERQISLRASIGYAACTDQGGHQAEGLSMRADLALHAAKGGGRGRIRAYDDSLSKEADLRARLTEELGIAVERSNFEPFYQPQVRLRSDEVVAFEALVRWRHPLRGLIEPGQFIAMAEETGQIRSIGAMVLRAACDQATTWPQRIRLAVNVSPLQLESPDFESMLRHCLQESGLAPQRLELEVTETTLVSAASQATLIAITRLGVTISVDDFGTGYSSFASLHSLSPTMLKIDRSLIARLAVDPAAQAVLRAIVDMARALGLSTAAEGVETPDQLEVVRQLGCDVIQGYLEARPMPADQVHRYLAERPTNPDAPVA